MYYVPLRSEAFLVTLGALAFWPMTNLESQSALALLIVCEEEVEEEEEVVVVMVLLKIERCGKLFRFGKGT